MATIKINDLSRCEDIQVAEMKNCLGGTDAALSPVGIDKDLFTAATDPFSLNFEEIKVTFSPMLAPCFADQGGGIAYRYLLQVKSGDLYFLVDHFGEPADGINTANLSKLRPAG